MTPHLAYGLLTGLAFLDLLALIVIGRGRLERRREAQCRILAQDLTAKVRERCEAYRRLEQRIAGVIDDFDRHEAFSSEEPASLLPRRPVTQVERTESAL